MRGHNIDNNQEREDEEADMAELEAMYGEEEEYYQEEERKSEHK